jgi:hypothetical protein
MYPADDKLTMSPAEKAHLPLKPQMGTFSNC